jgi:glycine/D-amino acid oxidase-like deaminating enzyme
MDLTSGYPYWPVKNGLLQAYPPLDTEATCDVLVIGGGITGALIAFHLIEAGVDAVIIDKRDIGWGSTGATTGLLQYEIDSPLADLIDLVGEDHAVRAYLACLDAVKRLEQLVDRLDDRSGFEQKTSVYLASRRRDVKLFKREYDLRRRHGIRLDWLDKRDIASRYSFARPAALLSYDAAQVDAYRLTHTLLRHARKGGMRVFDRSEVTSVVAGTSGIVAQVARQATISARMVVLETV